MKTSKGGFQYVTPDSIMKNDDTDNLYSNLMETIQTAYDALIEAGIRPEDARYVLPNAGTTNITISFNLRSFMDFYGKRNFETHAQWEIAELADALKSAVVNKEPWVEEVLKF